MRFWQRGGRPEFRSAVKRWSIHLEIQGSKLHFLRLFHVESQNVYLSHTTSRIDFWLDVVFFPVI